VKRHDRMPKPKQEPTSAPLLVSGCPDFNGTRLLVNR
jgi:hypothetical protein